MIALELDPCGVILAIRAQAGARTNGLRGEQSGALKVSVTQVPEKGKANKAIVSLLSKELSLRRSQIELISGATTPQKGFLIRDVTIDELSREINSALS